MNKTRAFERFDENPAEEGRSIPDELAPDDVSRDPYGGVDLAPITLESLETWDVSGHARRDQERIRSAAARIPPATLDTR